MTVLKLARRDLRAHLGRLILTGIAIVGGVGFVAGAFVLADSLTATFDTIFEDANADVDGRVQAAEPEFGNEPTFLPESIVGVVDDLPEVERAVPTVFIDDEEFYTPFAGIDDNGDEIVPRGPPILSFTWDGTDNALFTNIEGTPPQAIDEIALNRAFADKIGVAVGDTYTFRTPFDGDQNFTVSTIIDFKATGGAWFAMFDFASGQVWYDKEGLVDTVDLTGRADVTGAALVAAVEAVLPVDAGAEVINQADIVADETAEFNEIIGLIRNALLGFAGVALFVSLFIIYNTFAILVGQRIRQIGMLRALGASSAQVRLSIMFEALIVGVLGSLAGIGFGLVVATGIKALFNAMGGFPETGTVLETRTIVVALIVGIGATLVSALGPALRASKVSPIAAMTADPSEHGNPRRRIVLGGVASALGLALLGVGLFGGMSTSALLSALAVGSILTFIGVSLLAVLFAGWFVDRIGRARVLGGLLLAMGVALPLVIFTVGDGLPEGAFTSFTFVLKMLVSAAAILIGASIIASAARGGRPVGVGGSAAGLEGTLARENAARSPQRTAATATALTIGVALIATVGTVGESLKATFSDTLDRAVGADLFVYEDENDVSSFDEALGQSMAQIDGIDQLSRFRTNEARIDGEVVDFGAYDASTGTDIVDFDVTSGSVAALLDGGVLVHTDDADGLAVGDFVTVEFPNLTSAEVPIAGIYEDASVLGNAWIVDMSLYEANIDDAEDAFLGATIAADADVESVKAQAVALAEPITGVVVQDNAEFTASQEGQVDSLIRLINSLLGFALFVAFLGVVNTIALSVIERTREIGLLRAVGMTRGQLKSSIRWEAVMVCLFGAVVGIALGVLFATAAVSAIPDTIIATTAIPYETILFAVLSAALAGVLAAAIPARRAAKMDVLSAIATS